MEILTLASPPSITAIAFFFCVHNSDNAIGFIICTDGLESLHQIPKGTIGKGRGERVGQGRSKPLCIMHDDVYRWPVAADQPHTHQVTSVLLPKYESMMLCLQPDGPIACRHHASSAGDWICRLHRRGGCWLRSIDDTAALHTTLGGYESSDEAEGDPRLWMGGRLVLPVGASFGNADGRV